MEALKAATLKLPINKSLGFAYIVPYKDAPSFQIGYKGYLQLAMRTGQYKYINADIVYEGEEVKTDRVTGATTISGEVKSSNAVGYFAYIQMINGFEKMIYWPKDKVISHAKKFSKTYGGANSSWATNFDAMALKTMIRNLLSKYGIMSVEMISAMSSDTDERNPEARADEEIEREANAGDVIDVEVVPESEMQSTGTDGPSF
jgi:recombination protein RecT